ncbi:MAG: hypothetical protein ACRDBP_04590 [Luteolibacter sp.]
MFLASPAIYYGMSLQDRSPAGRATSVSAHPAPASVPAVSIPVEVIAAGGEPQWIYVQVQE